MILEKIEPSKKAGFKLSLVETRYLFILTLALLDKRVRELEEGWVSQRQEKLLDDYVVASKVDLRTSPRLMIWLELQQDWIAPNVPDWIVVSIVVVTFYWEL